VPPVPEEGLSQTFWLFRCQSEGHLAVTYETPAGPREFLSVFIQSRRSVPYVRGLVEDLPPPNSGFRPRIAFVRFRTVFLDALMTGRGSGSSVGIVTDYGLDGPGSNPGGDEIFRPSRPALGPTQRPVQWVPGLSRG